MFGTFVDTSRMLLPGCDAEYAYDHCTEGQGAGEEHVPGGRRKVPRCQWKDVKFQNKENYPPNLILNIFKVIFPFVFKVSILKYYFLNQLFN